MRVVIVGVGDIGLGVADKLMGREDNEVVLVDSDEKRCEELSKKYEALVICGDGTDPDILQKAQVGDADALVATTGLDPINTVIGMLGRQLDVVTVVVKLNGAGLRAACKAIGVTRVVAPKIAAAGHIESALYGLDRIDFSMIARGGLQLAEYLVRQLEVDSISDLELPDGAHIAAVSRGDDVLIPRDGMNLNKDDSLLILLESDEAKEKLDSRVESHKKEREKENREKEQQRADKKARAEKEKEEDGEDEDEDDEDENEQ
jgi:trk system potassium uptake protein TrkA